MPMGSIQRRLKRGVDIVVAVVGLVMLAPVIALIALAVRLDLGAPVLFRQPRPGLCGRPFVLMKFRTMTAGEGADDARTTRLGRTLRAWSLDELPQLWNVLKGEMSLVGPRPLLMRYLPLYSPDQARRHEVRPGLTGLAQVSGRNALSWEDRFALDVRYVDEASLPLDLMILWRTLLKVVRREGVLPDGQAVTPPFDGPSGRGPGA